MIKKLSAEAIGTFWLVFGGCGSAVLAAGFPGLGIGFAGVALAFGLTVLTMAYAVGHVSGGHFNPAVTLGLAVGRRIPGATLVPYSDRPGRGRPRCRGRALHHRLRPARLGCRAASPRTATASISPGGFGLPPAS